MESSQTEITPAVQASQEYSTRIFFFALELIPAFGIPAIFGIYLNKLVLETYPNVGSAATATIFFTMYVASWAFVIKRYRAIKKMQKK